MNQKADTMVFKDY